MSLLFSCQSVAKSYGPRTLFQDLSLSIFEKDRIALIGPNGSGKSTFLKIVAGLEKADAGTLSPRRGLKIGYVPQHCDFPGLPPEQIVIAAIEEDLPDYEKERLAQTELSKWGFSGSEPAAALLSGGWKKRLRIVQELVRKPDLLLLDEPTNHLDLEGILALEAFLARTAPTYLLVSHDRYFLQHAATRIIEIDPAYPGGMFAIDGDYLHFLKKKEEFLLGQIQQERSLASKARRETQWLRQGAKARTTKSQSRIDEAQELFQEHAAVQKRNQQKKAGIDFAATERETRKLLVAKNLAKSAGGGKILFKHLDLTLSPGTRIGLMGPNGSGKTTLLRLLAGEIEPDQGTIKRADALQTVYFDQHRAQLSPELTLRDALSPNGEYVLFRGQPIHVNGWCKRFLFSPDLLDLQIGRLSGGEKARISIAHLMLQPADVLLLDEPANDLDIPTLERLEESLLEFPGAVVLITHDRCMLDRTCNLLLALGDPETTRLYADFAQWENAQVPPSSPKNKEKESKPTPSRGKASSLSYKEKKEYEEIEGKILQLEQEIQNLNRLLELPENAENPQKLTELCTAIGAAETQLERHFLRWEELDKKQNRVH